ncbi:hypothetical protein PFISCL1PPCAC_11230, partial [Pristionchus fissidentatus]
QVIGAIGEGMEPPRDVSTSMARYGQLREIGEGSYSTVYAGFDKERQLPVAIKSCLKRQIVKEKKAQYVHREKNVLARISAATEGGHPLIVTLYATLQDEAHLYFVLSFAEKGDLLHLMFKQPGKRFPLESTVFYAAQITAAMQFCHSHSIVHRDIKPENVLIRASGHIMLSDFGSCKDLSEPVPAAPAAVAASTTGPAPLQRRASFVGTAQYVCPEILTGDKVTRASDYWSLGVVVYQLLTGKHAFHDESEYLMFRRIRGLLYKFPEDFAPEAKDLVEKLLVIEPQLRLGCADVFEKLAGESHPQHDEDALRDHPFFLSHNVPWADVLSMKPPPVE